MLEVGQLIDTIISYLVVGLIMMAIGFFTLKYFVRMIMNEVFDMLKQRVLNNVSSKDKDKSKPKNRFKLIKKRQ